MRLRARIKKEIIDVLIEHGTQVLLATNQPELP